MKAAVGSTLRMDSLSRYSTMLNEFWFESVNGARKDAYNTEKFWMKF